MDAGLTDDDVIERALGYPFELPTDSYLFVNGVAERLEEFDPADFPGHEPVLAYGSNSSAAQLALKYGDMADDVPIPVVKARLYDFDAVYAAHIASYGSIPATLQASPGTVVQVYVTYLDAEALRRMHDTESIGVSYGFGKLSGIRLASEYGPSLESCWAYVALGGCLAWDGSCISLCEIRAEGRLFASATQTDVQRTALELTAGGMGLRAFVLENARNDDARRRRVEALRARALPLESDHWRPSRAGAPS